MMIKTTLSKRFIFSKQKSTIYSVARGNICKHYVYGVIIIIMFVGVIEDSCCIDVTWLYFFVKLISEIMKRNVVWIDLEV